MKETAKSLSDLLHATIAKIINHGDLIYQISVDGKIENLYGKMYFKTEIGFVLPEEYRIYTGGLPPDTPDDGEGNPFRLTQEDHERNKIYRLFGDYCIFRNYIPGGWGKDIGSIIELMGKLEGEYRLLAEILDYFAEIPFKKYLPNLRKVDIKAWYEIKTEIYKEEPLIHFRESRLKEFTSGNIQVLRQEDLSHREYERYLADLKKKQQSKNH